MINDGAAAMHTTPHHTIRRYTMRELIYALTINAVLWTIFGWAAMTPRPPVGAHETSRPCVAAMARA